MRPEQIGAEAVHHRHDDDQGGDAERDPEQRKDRDDRDEAFLPARPQIAERDHPLERVEDHASFARGALTRLALLGTLSRNAGEGDPAQTGWVGRGHASSTGHHSGFLGNGGKPIERRVRGTRPAARPCAVLELDRAAGDAARADDELLGQADQVHRREFGAGRLVAVVVQHLDAGAEQLGVEILGGVAAARVARPQVDQADANGATLSGQMMPASSWLASISAPTRRDTPMP